MLLICAALACGACSRTADKDGVPAVDIHGTIVEVSPAKKVNGWSVPAQRQRMIKVGDKQMPLQEFLLTYCQAKWENETCARGTKIERIDSSRGPVETLPKGL
jgi:hypothetical protein